MDQENTHEAEDEFLDEMQIQQRKEEEAHRERVKQGLRDFGVKVDEPVEGVEPASPVSRGNALDALGDFSNARMIPLEGLGEVEAAEDKEPDPLRREGSGVFSEAAREEAGRRDDPGDDDPWSRTIPGLGTVRATEEHKEIYEDVFFSDEPLELPVSLTIGSGDRRRDVVVECRTLSAYEREISAQATYRALDGNPLLKRASAQVIGEYFRRVDMLMCVKSVGGETWPCVRCEAVPDVKPADDPAVERLVGLLQTHFSRTQGRKFALVSKAMHIFEVLNDILDDAEINGDFTDPAG